MIPASSLIDFDALWKIVVAGFAGGAGVVVAFVFVLLGRSHYAQAREGDVVEPRRLRAPGRAGRRPVRGRPHRRLHRADQEVAIDNPRAPRGAN
jgi:hypothetical protein